jgi:hypothetical protein
MMKSTTAPTTSTTTPTKNGSEGTSSKKFDRRRVFATMKYNRPPSVRTQQYYPQGSVAAAGQMRQASSNSLDEMPDIHMVESQLSLFSNLSLMDTTTSRRDLSTPSGHKVDVEIAKVIDHSAGSRRNVFGEVLHSGSHHSIMSGLMSEGSNRSIFSDLGRKIGNFSTRSMAMSDISGFDLQERDNEDESTSTGIGFDRPLEGTPTKPQPDLDFDF